MATRRSQPYRAGARPPGAALDAMLRGRSLSGANPQDIQRTMQVLARAGKRNARSRPARPKRPARPPR